MDMGAILAEMGLDTVTLNTCACCAHPQAAAAKAKACCSKVVECVLLLQNVFFCYRMCSFAIECVCYVFFGL